jgi:hypothetical protein
VQLLLAIALTAVGPLVLKTLFWCQAVIFLSLMNRAVGPQFWKFTPAEIALSLIMSSSYIFGIFYPSLGSGYLWAPFMFSALAWLTYSTVRTWREAGLRPVNE